MKRVSFALTGLAAAALALLAIGTAGAAPKNATELTLDCGDDGSIEVLVQLDSSGAAAFDVSSEGGRAYLLTSLDGRVYLGALEVEPDDDDPDFTFMQEWGNRNGFGEPIACSGMYMDEDPEFGTFTVFFDVTLVSK